MKEDCKMLNLTCMCSSDDLCNLPLPGSSTFNSTRRHCRHKQHQWSRAMWRKVMLLQKSLGRIMKPEINVNAVNIPMRKSGSEEKTVLINKLFLLKIQNMIICRLLVWNCFAQRRCRLRRRATTAVVVWNFRLTPHLKLDADSLYCTH